MTRASTDAARPTGGSGVGGQRPRRTLSIAFWDNRRGGEEGVVLSKEGQRAVCHPAVAREPGWTRDETLTYLSRKAGLAADAWRVGTRCAVLTTTTDTGSSPAR